jgi:hypothetical protein
MPVAEPTVAKKVLALLQIPPGMGAINVVVKPLHTPAVPIMGPPVVVTVTVLVA